MAYLVLARKYRPQRFADVVAQEHVTRTLAHALSAGRVAHGILFSGPRGTGKTTVARILAKALNCGSGPAPEPCNACRSCTEITAGHSVDVFEIDGASNNGVEQVRELRENVKYMPAHSRYKIYIIDEVHMLSLAAFNALLKTLEEPPAHVIFLFATTEPHKIPVTILSRCQRFDFRRVRLESVARFLEGICRAEGLAIDPESLDLIARESGGSIRDSLSLLDQVIACGADAGRYAEVLDILGVVDRRRLREMAAGLLARDASAVLGALEDVYDRGHDIKKLHADLLEYFRNLAVFTAGDKARALIDLPAHEIAELEPLVRQSSPAFILQVLATLFRQEASVRLAPQPKLALEMLFFQILQAEETLAVDALIEKLDQLRREIRTAPAPAPRPSVRPLSAPAESAPGDRGFASPGPPKAEPGGKPGDWAGRAQGLSPEEVWRRLLEKLAGDYPSLAATLKRGGLKSTDSKRIEIHVPGNQFAAGVLRRDKNLALLREALSEILGEPREVAIVSAGDTPPTAGGRHREQQRKQEALNHPLVAESLEIFKGGQLVEVKIIEEEKE